MSRIHLTRPGFLIREMSEAHWPEVAQIYKQGIDTGFATFEKEIPSYEQWNRNHNSSCRLVALRDDMVVGWAALSPVSGRCVYGGVAEVSVYVAEKARGLSIGKLLMAELITASEIEGMWTLQSGIFPENTASIKLHEKTGFRYLGKRERIGQLDGIWKDNLLFERRSEIVGIN
ncbi:GNAT family N-acetyltransferase [uncultured Eudoraea sp.]|uniref:GNAT family N-acetyltransferase n=1 Tax=uncultured Eudoraea sp. TaxID=1035614 RepID=UPI002616F81A|nr:GNAT family N-acetyltransferase [uncultured Eudoraea sp.]